MSKADTALEIGKCIAAGAQLLLLLFVMYIIFVDLPMLNRTMDECFANRYAGGDVHFPFRKVCTDFDNDVRFEVPLSEARTHEPLFLTQARRSRAATTTLVP